MIPLNLLTFGAKQAFGAWQKRSAEKAAMKHQIDLEEMRSGNHRARRKWSVVADIFLALLIMWPLLVLGLGPFIGLGPEHTQHAKDYIEFIKQLPPEYYYVILIVYAGNFSVSLGHVLGNKTIVKQITGSK